jgi:Tol biopolymer transport system component
MHFQEQPLPRYQVALLPPEKTAFVPVQAQAGGMAISPDGRTLAFVAEQEGRRQLWVRRLDSSSARPLPGTENAHYPFWSPDNRWVGFFTGTQLKKIEVAGGPPQVICDATTTRGGSWNREGTIVFSGNDRTMHRVPAAGGRSVKLTELDRAEKENAHYWPEFLPDGRHFLYLARSSAAGMSAIRIGSIDDQPGGARGIEVTKASANARYVPPDGIGWWESPSGWLLFMRDTVLFAQPFDASAFKVKGEPLALAERPGFLANISYANFSTSRNGVLVYGGEGAEITRLTWIGRDGKESPATADGGTYLGPSLAPDGARVAVPMVERQASNVDIWLIDLAHPVATRFTFDPSPDISPIWSPDGNRIAFGSSREGRTHIYVKPANSAIDEQRIGNSSLTQYPNDWSRDGKNLLYTEIGDNTGADLWVLDLASKPQATPFLKTSFNESLATFSPDGKWIAYTSDESGRQEVYVRNFPGASAKFQISNNGGGQPRWRGDGKELYYISSDRKLMVVNVRAAAGIFERETPKALFEMHGVRSGSLAFDYDVTRDGQRFLSAVPLQDEGVRPLMLITDWRADLNH